MTGALQQRDFARALLDPALPAPPGLVCWNGSDPQQRFAVYRNNVVVSLVDALAARFPVVLALVGEEFFRAMARVFVCAQPPRSPLMAEYGEAFPAFIADFAPAAGLPYLPDVAALEAARTRAYHATDATALGPADFAGIAPEALPDLVVEPHPSAQIIVSRFAVFSLWAAHQGKLDIGEVDPFTPEDALVVRPKLEVEVSRLPPGAAGFLNHLASGERLGEAATRATGACPAFDVAGAFQLLLATGFAAKILLT